MKTATSPSAVVPFCFNDNLIRTIAINDEPWFVAKDVCAVLEKPWNGATTLDFLDDDEKGVSKFDTPSGIQEMLIISESGLYTLIIRSNKPQARPFRKWVTAEVLPAIRRTGGYSLNPADKRVFVNHSHKRDSAAPGGLDIRYTMDLSKIITRPTRTTIELLERLTGLPLVDILPEPTEDGDIVEEFFRARLEMVADAGPDTRLRLAAVHALFLDWHVERFAAPTLRSAKWLAGRLRAMGQTVQKSGGVTWVYGLRAREVEA